MQSRELDAILIAGVSIRNAVIGDEKTVDGEEILDVGDVEETEYETSALRASFSPLCNSCRINPESH
jgi:hypothetical protein